MDNSLEYALEEINALTSVIERVRNLHKQTVDDNAACGDLDCCGEYEEYDLCADCNCDYPCPTIKILDNAKITTHDSIQRVRALIDEYRDDRNGRNYPSTAAALKCIADELESALEGDKK